MLLQIFFTIFVVQFVSLYVHSNCSLSMPVHHFDEHSKKSGESTFPQSTWGKPTAAIYRGSSANDGVTICLGLKKKDVWAETRSMPFHVLVSCAPCRSADCSYRFNNIFSLVARHALFEDGGDFFPQVHCRKVDALVE